MSNKVLDTASLVIRGHGIPGGNPMKRHYVLKRTKLVLNFLVVQHYFNLDRTSAALTHYSRCQI